MTDCQLFEDFSEWPSVPAEEAPRHSADAADFWDAARSSFVILASSVVKISSKSFPRAFVCVFGRYPLVRPRFAGLLRHVIACSEWAGSQPGSRLPSRCRHLAVVASWYLVLRLEGFAVRRRSAVWPFALQRLGTQELGESPTRLALGEIGQTCMNTTQYPTCGTLSPRPRLRYSTDDTLSMDSSQSSLFDKHPPRHGQSYQLLPSIGKRRSSCCSMSAM